MPDKMRRAVKRCRALTAALLPLALSSALSSALSLAAPRPVRAETAAPDPCVQITPAQAAAFVSAFTALSQQAHVALVAEDQPLHLALTPRAAAELKLNPDGEPLSTLLPKLAGAYDYDVVPSGKLFLLEKRYTDPADLPSVTAKECALGLAELDGYAETFNPHLPLGLPDRSPIVSDLIYSLTPEQLAAMGDSKRGVPVAALSLVQQQEVWQFLLHLDVQTAITDLPNTIGAINRVAATDPQFGWRDCAKFSNPMFARRYAKANLYLFGYDSTSTSGKPLFITMSKPDQIRASFDGVIHVSPRQQEVGAPQAEGQFASGDVTDPPPGPADAPPPVSASLADLLTRMNVQAAGPKGDGLKVTLPPYLAPKQATVFGAEAATPRQEVAALAQVYGLRVFTEDKEGGHDRLRLTRQTAQVPLDALALHDSLLQSLPAPLVRACRKHSAFGYVFPPDPMMPSGLSPLLVSAVRQIRTAAEPKIRASKDGHVSLSALSEREGRAFAVTLMVDVMESLRGLTRAAPPKELTRFGELRLTGGLSDDKDGKKRLSLLLALPNPSDPSTLQAGIGVGGMNYDPINHTF